MFPATGQIYRKQRAGGREAPIGLLDGSPIISHSPGSTWCSNLTWIWPLTCPGPIWAFSVCGVWCFLSVPPVFVHLSSPGTGSTSGISSCNQAFHCYWWTEPKHMKSCSSFCQFIWKYIKILLFNFRNCPMAVFSQGMWHVCKRSTVNSTEQRCTASALMKKTHSSHWLIKDRSAFRPPVSRVLRVCF